MSKFPEQIVAAPGFAGPLRITRQVIELTQFEPVSLKNFTDEELQASVLLQMMDKGWVIEYTGQDLPKDPARKIVIPVLKNKGEDKLTAKITQSNIGKAVDTKVDLPPDFSEKLQKRTENARASIEADEKATMKELEEIDSLNTGKEKFDPATMKAPTSVIIDGKPVSTVNGIPQINMTK